MPPTIHSIEGIEVVIGSGLEIDHDDTLPEVVPSTAEKYSDTKSPKLQEKRKPKINWNKVVLGAAVLAVGVTVATATLFTLKARENLSAEAETSLTSSMLTISSNTVKNLIQGNSTTRFHNIEYPDTKLPNINFLNNSVHRWLYYFLVEGTNGNSDDAVKPVGRGKPTSIHGGPWRYQSIAGMDSLPIS
ncbi:hypothetical protein F4818DRAFT_452155 [Hypoxylon cercidicola]|nr:hypothetical protein F4818DRAFT_452155 [Hypoxylon cercidicola]